MRLLAGANRARHDAPLFRLLAAANVAAVFPVYGIHDDAVAQLKKIDGFDYGGDNCGEASNNNCWATTAAVQLDGAVSNSFATKVSLHGVHAEGNMTSGGCTPAIKIAGGETIYSLLTDISRDQQLAMLNVTHDLNITS